MKRNREVKNFYALLLLGKNGCFASIIGMK